MAAVGKRFDSAIIDQTKVHDVDRDFRIETGTQLLPDSLLQRSFLFNRLAPRRLPIAEAECIAIAAVDAYRVTVIGHHRIAAAQRLSKPHLATAFKR